MPGALAPARRFDATCEVVGTVLTLAGAEVRTCASAATAREELRRWHPDVLVSDVGMPGEHGYSLIRALRRAGVEDGGRIPAVALTAYARPEDRVRALGAGFQTHVAKPIEPKELVAVVASLAESAGKVPRHS